MKSGTCRRSPRTFRHLKLPAALLLVLLATTAWGGNSCELIDADTDTEYDGDNDVGSDDALACGFDNQISGDNGTVIGNGNIAYDGATAVGYDNDARDANSSAFGYSNIALNSATAVGYDNDARDTNSSAFGYSNIANEGATAVGNDNDARFGTSSAFGSRNTAYESSAAIGHNNYAGRLWDDENGNGIEDPGEVGRYASAVGHNNAAYGNASAAFGYQNAALGEYSAALGMGGSASGTGASAIGGGGLEIDLENFPVPVEGGRDTVQISGREIGFLWRDVDEPLSLLNVESIDGKAVTIDLVNEIYRWGDRDVTGEELSALYASAIYGGSIALGEHATAVGSRSTAFGDRSLAVGTHAFADGDGNVAIGADAVASGASSVALGADSVADRANTVSVGSAGHERQITNVAAGTQATDAVNLSQLQDTLATANAYTDTAVATGGTQANAYTDNREAAIRDDMTAGDAGTLESANAYTDNTATQTLTAANAYTDNRVNALSDDFDAYRGAIDQRLGLQDDRIDRVGALGAAMIGMAASAAAVESGATRIAAAAGTYGGKNALSVGLQRRLGARAALTFGGAFSGSERSATVGVGFGF